VLRDVPVGLVASDWGGTYVQAWSSPDALAKCPKSAAAQISVKLPPHANLGGDNPNQPSVLYNAMIHPLLGLKFSGAFWYQGEANANDPKGYACMFPAMIEDWRQKLQQPSLPFVFVDLAAYPDGGGMYPAIRMAQLAALALPRTGVVYAYDLGDPKSPVGSIHPRDKETIAHRALMDFLDIVYNKKFDDKGPQMLHAKQSGNVVSVSFEDASGLALEGTEGCSTCCKESPFEIAGADGAFVRAAVSAVQGDKVLIDAGNKTVVAVRMDWSDYPQCALFNADTLPASPFLTQVTGDEELRNELYLQLLDSIVY